MLCFSSVIHQGPYFFTMDAKSDHMFVFAAAGHLRGSEFGLGIPSAGISYASRIRLNCQIRLADRRIIFRTA